MEQLMDLPRVTRGIAEPEACGRAYGEKTRLAVKLVLVARPDLAEREALRLVLQVMAN